MFNVTNFVLAGVLVALVGGFPLGGVLPLRPGEVSRLAAVVTTARPPQANPSTTASEKPPVVPDATVRTDILPGVGLTVEEVEPGTYRILDDGAGHDFQQRLEGVVPDEPAGDVWIRSYGSGELFSLGGEGSLSVGFLSGSDRTELAVAPDGRIWALDDHEDDPWRTTLRYFDGRAWVEQPLPDRDDPDRALGSPGRTDIAISRDGRVWVAMPRDPKEPVIAVLADGEWTILPSIQKAWKRSQDQRGESARHDCCDMAVEPDGTVWLASDRSILRYDRRGWQSWNVIGWDGCAGYGTSPHVGPDGRLWLHFGGHVGGAAKNLVERGIIPVPGPDAPNCDGGGRPYMRGAGPGVLSFDGRRWRQYLAGHCISDVAVTADGTVWVADEGAEEEGDGIGLYVITPKGVAAAR